MALIKVPPGLRSKLGAEATEELVDLFTAAQQHQETRMIHVFKDSVDLRIALSEEKMMGCIRDSEDKMMGCIRDSEDKMMGCIRDSEQRTRVEINDLRKETHKGFLDVQKQITGQTRWIIVAVAFVGVVMKTLDLLLK